MLLAFEGKLYYVDFLRNLQIEEVFVMTKKHGMTERSLNQNQVLKKI